MDQHLVFVWTFGVHGKNQDLRPPVPDVEPEVPGLVRVHDGEQLEVVVHVVGGEQNFDIFRDIFELLQQDFIVMVLVIKQQPCPLLPLPQVPRRRINAFVRA